MEIPWEMTLLRASIVLGVGSSSFFEELEELPYLVSQ